MERCVCGGVTVGVCMGAYTTLSDSTKLLQIFWSTPQKSYCVPFHQAQDTLQELSGLEAGNTGYYKAYVVSRICCTAKQPVTTNWRHLLLAADAICMMRVQSSRPLHDISSPAASMQHVLYPLEW